MLELPELPPHFRRFEPEDVHLTLSFLGGCGEAAAMRGFEALAGQLAASPRPSVALSLGSVVPMGPKRDYSALSALLERGRDEATSLITELRHVVSDAALGRREQRAVKPHVSLARPRRSADQAARVAGLGWAASLDLSHVTATLDRVALYTWSEGARRQRLFHIVTERALGPC